MQAIPAGALVEGMAELGFVPAPTMREGKDGPCGVVQAGLGGVGRILAKEAPTEIEPDIRTRLSHHGEQGGEQERKESERTFHGWK